MIIAVLTALQREYPHRRRFTILEDNDPTGFTSKAGVKAKEDSNLDVFEIPKHSPQLNVLDYYLWSAMNKRKRATGKNYRADKKEKRPAFLRRLTRTAKSIPHEDILEAQRSIQVRCARLVDAKEDQIEG